MRAAPAEGGKLVLALTLAGKTCGEVRVEARPVAAPSGDGVVLTEVKLVPFERERVMAVSPKLDPTALERVIWERGRLSLPIEAFVIPRQLNSFASRLLGTQKDSADASPVELSVSATESKLTTVQVGAEGLLANVEIRGETKIVIRGGL
ncbi:MAG: hypothetical protein U0165_19550 [Polyangiaceae bacterium]